jgi:organic radical activating enzyme
MFGFEITRKCNMKCRHCMRGEAQNHTITKEVIDKALDEIDTIVGLALTGGEPFLEPEIIDYLFDEIIRRKIRLLAFSCVTNGSIQDERIAQIWNKLSTYILENYGNYLDEKHKRMIGRITVSNDDYHTLKTDPLDTVKFYRKHLNKNCIALKETKKDNDRVWLLGRAAQDEEIKKQKNVWYHVCPYKLEMDDHMITTMLMVGYDGKIMIGEDCSYEQQDKVNYVNVMDDNI